jgi:hypothetical protein
MKKIICKICHKAGHWNSELFGQTCSDCRRKNIEELELSKLPYSSALDSKSKNSFAACLLMILSDKTDSPAKQKELRVYLFGSILLNLVLVIMCLIK